MATPRHDKADGTRPPLTDRVLDAARHAEQVAHEARRLTEHAAEVLEDGLHTAKRTFTRRRHELEDLRDQAEVHVRKNPWAALAVTFGAGLVMGVIIGRAGGRSRG